MFRPQEEIAAFFGDFDARGPRASSSSRSGARPGGARRRAGRQLAVRSPAWDARTEPLRRDRRRRERRTAADARDARPSRRFSRRWAARWPGAAGSRGRSPRSPQALRPLDAADRARRPGRRRRDPELGRDVGARAHAPRLRHDGGHRRHADRLLDGVRRRARHRSPAARSSPAGPRPRCGRASPPWRPRSPPASPTSPASTRCAAQEELQRAALAAVRTAEAERRTSEARFRALFAQAAVGIGILSMEGRVIDANAAWAAQMGYPVEEMRGRTIRRDRHARRLAGRLRSSSGSCSPARATTSGWRSPHTSRDGRLLCLDLSSPVSAPPVPSRTSSSASPSTSPSASGLEERLWHESRHDPLTGLPNRTLFFERLGDAARRAAGGAAAGRRSATSTWTASRASTTASGTTSATGCWSRVADRLGEAVDGAGQPAGPARRRRVRHHHRRRRRRPTPASRPGACSPRWPRRSRIDGRELTVSASVGVVDTGTAGTEADGLMRAADISLYLAKSRGRGRWERHDPQADAHQVTRHTLATEMSAALGPGRVLPRVPAAGVAARRRGAPGRGAAAVAAPAPRAAAPGPVHRHGRGERPHRARSAAGC